MSDKLAQGRPRSFGLRCASQSAAANLLCDQRQGASKVERTQGYGCAFNVALDRLTLIRPSASTDVSALAANHEIIGAALPRPLLPEDGSPRTFPPLKMW